MMKRLLLCFVVGFMSFSAVSANYTPSQELDEKINATVDVISDILIHISEVSEFRVTNFLLKLRAYERQFSHEGNERNTYVVQELSSGIGSTICEYKGGTWRKMGGFLNEYGCLMTYPDGGKICNSSSECEGSCIYTNSEGSPTYCQYNNKIQGLCYGVVEHKRYGIMCLD